MSAPEFSLPTVYLADHVQQHGVIGESWTIIRETPRMRLTQSDRGVHVESDRYHEVYPWSSILKASNVPERRKGKP